MLGKSQQKIRTQKLKTEGKYQQAGFIDYNKAWFNFRYKLVMFVILLLFSVVTTRLLFLGFAVKEDQKSSVITNKKSKQPREIVDRNGVLLAANMVNYSLAINPKKFNQADSSIESLVEILTTTFPNFDKDTDGASLAKKIQTRKNFFYFLRGVMDDKVVNLRRQGIVGLEIIRQNARMYPQGKLFAHVVGYRNGDNQGVSGIEKGYDNLLLSYDKKDTPLITSLDVRLQTLLYTKLEKVYNQTEAKGASGVIVDANTSEILAMVSYPSFNPHSPSMIPKDAALNRAALRYEMGSTFKVFNTALALDEGLSIYDKVDIKDTLRVAEFDITDDYTHASVLSIEDIIIHSSNSGSARIALGLGIDKQKSFLTKLGLLDPTGLMLPELTSPKYPEIWALAEVVTIAYGYGISVTPIHMATAVSSLVNGGVWREVRIILDSEEVILSNPKRVVSKEVSKEVSGLLRSVVDRGTGAAARIRGYLVGGKTGTTKKFDKLTKSYTTGKNLTSFVGVFPTNNPQIVAYLLVDEPKFDYIKHSNITTGGNVVSPIFKEIIEEWLANMHFAPKYKNDHSTSYYSVKSN